MHIARLTVLGNLRSPKVSVDRTWFPSNVQLTCISPVRSLGTNETPPDAFEIEFPDRFTICPEFLLAVSFPVFSLVYFRSVLERLRSTRARARAREREREKHTAGGHKSRFAIAGHWKRLMKPLWAKNTSLTVLGNWGGGGGRITIERTARFRFDAQWNYAWVQRLDDTGGVNISSVTSLASDSVVANCRVHFVSSLPSYYAGSSTLLVRRSCFSFSFFFFFF